MTQDQLRQEFKRLDQPRNVDDCHEALDMFCNCLISLIKSHHADKLSEPVEHEAMILLQMVMTKTLHVKSALSGVDFKSKSGLNLKNIIDPTIIAQLTRNSFETIGLFNLLFRTNHKGDERDIIFRLWVISGLNYRQRFEAHIIEDETRKKYLFEKEKIEILKNEIFQTHLYSNLSERDKSKILTQIKEKKFLIYFAQNEVKILNWSDLYRTLSITEQFFSKMYTYFSLYTHPSNVSVFQFESMFSSADKSNMSLALFNLNFLTLLLSVFIADYLNYFPEQVDKVYNQLPLVDQIIIDSHNRFARGPEFSINYSFEALG